MLDLSIIIVSFNTKNLTIDCIKSIIKNTHKISYEIIVVDNASDDGSTQAIDKLCSEKSNEFPSVELIKNASNLGYAKANNIGIKKANSKAVLLLNSDTIILEESIDKAYKKLQNADILTINLKNSDGTNQQAAGFGPNLLNIFCWAFFIDDLPGLNNIIHPYQISRVNYFDKDHKVDWVMGAFFLMKKQVIEKIGFLDENLFMYGEEMEYCKRARSNGFKIRYFASPSIIHLGMGSSESSEGAVVGEYKALKYFFNKYYFGFKKMLLNMILKLSAMIRMLIYYIIHRDRFLIYEKAYKSI